MCVCVCHTSSLAASSWASQYHLPVFSSLSELKAGGNKLDGGTVVGVLAAGVAQKLDLSSLCAPGLSSALLVRGAHACRLNSITLCTAPPPPTADGLLTTGVPQPPWLWCGR